MCLLYFMEGKEHFPFILILARGTIKPLSEVLKLGNSKSRT